MPENNKNKEFLQKLAPCIERGDLDACVGDAARVVMEMGVGAEGCWSCPRREEEIRWVLFEKCKKELSLDEKELEELEIIREKA